MHAILATFNEVRRYARRDRPAQRGRFRYNPALVEGNVESACSLSSVQNSRVECRGSPSKHSEICSGCGRSKYGDLPANYGFLQKVFSRDVFQCCSNGSEPAVQKNHASQRAGEPIQSSCPEARVVKYLWLKGCQLFLLKSRPERQCRALARVFWRMFFNGRGFGPCGGDTVNGPL
jgi:hypothetical protein